MISSTKLSLTTRRLASVDAFRALTMFLMIFVNDLGTLRDIPEWLDHAAKTEDRMGLADTVFPAFLFIVGLSIPFAIGRRESKGHSRKSTFIHILTRSLALLVMGIFHVNLENYSRTAAFLPKPIWQIGITIGFFLIWLDYSPQLAKRKKMLLQWSGVLLLAILALLYRGDDPEDGVVWMSVQWYGILGLIGWSYLICAIIYFLAKGRLSVIATAFVFFTVFDIAARAGWLTVLYPMRPYVWLVSNGALPALTMAGVMAMLIYQQLGKGGKVMAVLGLIALVTLISGFALRPFWGISKIRASPSWVLICTAISLGCLILLIYIVDMKGQEAWIAPIKPAGTSTLTCYLLPYIHYALLNLIGKSANLPLALRTGGVGIVKSLLYALVIILITGILEKRRLRLSI